MLPCHYLHNRSRKLLTNQINWFTFHLRKGVTLEISIRHFGWKSSGIFGLRLLAMAFTTCPHLLAPAA